MTWTASLVQVAPGGWRRLCGRVVLRHHPGTANEQSDHDRGFHRPARLVSHDHEQRNMQVLGTLLDGGEDGAIDHLAGGADHHRMLRVSQLTAAIDTR